MSKIQNERKWTRRLQALKNLAYIFIAGAVLLAGIRAADWAIPTKPLAVEEMHVYFHTASGKVTKEIIKRKREDND